MSRVWLVFAALIGLTLFGTAEGQAQIPLEQFVDKPALAAPKISPDGHYLAIPLRKDGGMVLAVVDLNAPKGTKPNSVYTGDLEIEWIEWKNNDRILLSLIATMPLKTSAYTGSRIGRFITSMPVRRVIAVNRDGSNPVGLMTPDHRFRANRECLYRRA